MGVIFDISELIALERDERTVEEIIHGREDEHSG
jgi:hypothetical protein